MERLTLLCAISVLLCLILQIQARGYCWERRLEFSVLAPELRTQTWDTRRECRLYSKLWLKWEMKDPSADAGHSITFLGQTRSYSHSQVRAYHNRPFEWSPMIVVPPTLDLTLRCRALVLLNGRIRRPCKLKLWVRYTDCRSCSYGQGRRPCTYESNRECYTCAWPQVSNGNQACYRCPGGFVPNYLRSECYRCAAGYYITSDLCEQCPKGSFNPSVGQYSCQTCTSNYKCPPGTVTPKACASGYQRSGETDCVVCDEGFVCDGLGEEGNRQICPAGSYCTNGNIRKCNPDRFCPEGSRVEGPICFGFGTLRYEQSTGTCQCHEGFAGEDCSLLIPSISSSTYASATFLNESLTHLQDEADGDCPCGMSYNDTTCLVDSDTSLTILVSFLTGSRAYQAGHYVEAIFGYSRAVECAYELNIVNTRTVLKREFDYLNGEILAGIDIAMNEKTKRDLYSTVVAGAYALNLATTNDPGKYRFNVFFDIASNPENMKLSMLPPFKQCEIKAILKSIEKGCGSTLADLEHVLAFARCALLDVEDLGVITLVPAEVFLIHAVYCLRSLSTKVDTRVATTEMIEIATFMEESQGPSINTQQILGLATTGTPIFVTNDTDQAIAVPPYPILYFEDNLGDKVDRIRALANRIGNKQRLSKLESVVDARARELNDLVQGSFEGLTTYLIEIIGNVFEAFALDGTTDAEAVLADLEGLVGLMQVELNRLKNSSKKLGEYMSVLNGERTTKLIKAWKKMVEIQFDIESARAALVKAQATLNLIKSSIAGK